MDAPPPSSLAVVDPISAEKKTAKAQMQREDNIHLAKLILELLPSSRDSLNEAKASLLNKLLAKYGLNWEVVHILSRTPQKRLMDAFYLIFRKARDNSSSYSFYSFWLLSLYHEIDYVTLPLLKGMTLYGRLPVHGGGYSDLYRGIYQGKHVAIKVPRLFSVSQDSISRRKLLKAFERELACTIYTRHPNILAPLGVDKEHFFFENPDPNPNPNPNHNPLPTSEPTPNNPRGGSAEPLTCLVYPFLANGTIDSYVYHHPRVNRMFLLFEAGSGIAFLHEGLPTIVHGDIKPGNVLIDDDGHAKIIDTGLASFADLVQNESSREFGLSWRYAAPELLDWSKLDNDGSHDEQSSAPIRRTTASDVYAFAMTIYQVIADVQPFGNFNPMFLLYRVAQGIRPPRPSTKLMTDDLWELVQQAWHHDPAKRPSMASIAQKLEEFAKLPIYQDA